MKYLALTFSLFLTFSSFSKEGCQKFISAIDSTVKDHGEVYTTTPLYKTIRLKHGVFKCFSGIRYQYDLPAKQSLEVDIHFFNHENQPLLKNGLEINAIDSNCLASIPTLSGSTLLINGGFFTKYDGSSFSDRKETERLHSSDVNEVLGMYPYITHIRQLLSTNQCNHIDLRASTIALKIFKAIDS